ncbi:MAG: hypothetical protein ABIH23_16770 [bacterium]
MPDLDLLQNPVIPDEDSVAAPIEPAVDPQIIIDALIQVMNEGTEEAYTLSRDEKLVWADNLAMRESRYIDGSSDKIGKRIIWQGYISKAIDTIKALMKRALIPDPGRMDFFDAVAKWPGVEPWVESIVALMRMKCKEARPRDVNGGLYGLLGMWLEDCFVLGTCMSIVTHEAIRKRNEDGVIEGPTPQYISAWNAWPWRTDCNTFNETATTIYDPIGRRELERGGFFNVKNVVKKYEDNALEIDDRAPRRENDEQKKSGSRRSGMFPRYIYLGPFPIYEIQDSKAELKDLSEWEIIQILAQKYEFDPAEAEDAEWWDIEWIGDECIQCRPYPTWIPIGKGPIAADTIYPRSKYIWGFGIYNRSAGEEWIANFFNRASMKICAWLAKPARYFRKDLVDREWLNLRGARPSIQPDDTIPIVGDYGSGKPFDFVDTHSGSALPAILNQIERGDQRIREQTGATSAVEGTDRSETATQNANNVAQSMSLIEDMEKDKEYGILLDVVKRMYIVQQQFMTETNEAELVPVEAGEQQLQTMWVRPEMVVGEDLIDFVMTGSSSPGNRMNQAQAFGAFVERWLKSGALDIMEAVKMDTKIMGLRGADKLIAQPNEEDAAKRLANILGAFGHEGFWMLSQADQMALMGGMGGMGGTPGGPLGGGMGPPGAVPMGAGQGQLPGPSPQGPGGGQMMP